MAISELSLAASKLQIAISKFLLAIVIFALASSELSLAISKLPMPVIILALETPNFKLNNYIRPVKIVRPILSFILLAAIILQTLGKFFIYADYIINKEAIAQKFCKNKNKPMMHCDGKCHIMKKMKEEDKKENNLLNNLKEKYKIQLFAELKTPSLELPDTYITVKGNSIYSSSESSSHLFSVFHPPHA